MFMIPSTIINKKEQAIAYNHSIYRLLIIIHILNKSFENTFFEGGLLKLTYVLKCMVSRKSHVSELIRVTSCVAWCPVSHM